MWVDTDRELATGPDSKFPNGIHFDNNTSVELIEMLEAELGNYSILDLGCAGGKWIIDNYEKGHTSLGLEGSDYCYNNSKAVGHLNWQQYYKQVLWNADISFPFTVKNEEGPVQFDVITAWEVLEHIPQDRLHTCLENINRHLKNGGIFLGTISTVSNTYKGIEYHQSILDRSIWINFILSKYFTVEKYPYRACPRGDAAPSLDLTSNDSIAVICRK